MSRSSGTMPKSGMQLALMLQERYPREDWLGGLAKAAVRPRDEIEQALTQDAGLPDFLLQALAALPSVLQPADPSSKDHVFQANTNDADAAMEVDGEAGVIVQPAEKPMPSRSGSPFEMRSKTPKAEKNQEFLPFSGVPEAIAPLHRGKREP